MRARFAGFLIAILIVGGAGLAGSVTAGTATDVASNGPGPGSASECAATSPDDFEDPDEDVIGWEAGYWYDEPLDIDQSDGLTDAELDALTARTMARVESIRCLEYEESVPVTVISRDELRGEMHNTTVEEDVGSFDNVIYESLFLVDETEDSVEVQQENRGAAVLGYYHPERNEIVVVSESGEDLQLDEATLAHELGHALQDQHFNLTRFDDRTVDGSLAQNGLIEGDVHYVEHQYVERCEEGDWEGTCIEQEVGDGEGGDGGGGGELANLGVYFVVFQPYSDGPTFVQHFHEDGGWAAVDQLYDDPPESTAQVVHPDRYGDDGPREVALDDDHADEWERIRPANRPDYETLGQAAIVSMFVFPTYDSEGRTQIVPIEQWVNTDAEGDVDRFDPLDYDQRYATGWDGDRLHAYRNDEGETAYVWRLAWQTDEDAETFLDGYERLLEYWNAERVSDNTYEIGSNDSFTGGYYVERDGSTVTIVKAPSVEELPSVHGETVDVERTNDAGEERTNDGDDAGDGPVVSTDGPGFGVAGAIAALFGVLVFARRCR